MTTKLLKGFIIVLGAIVLGIALLFFARDTSRIINWSGSGFVLSSVKAIDESLTVFHGVDTDDFIKPPYPTQGDTILTIADTAASHQRWIEVLESPHIPGREAVITFLHEGIEHTATMKTRPVQRTHFYAVVALQVLKLFIFLSFILVGFWAFFKRPDSPGVRVLTLYCITMSTHMVQTYMPMYTVMAWFQIPVVFEVFLGTISVFFGSFWLLLNLVFPQPSRIIQNRAWRGYSLCFAPQLVIIALFVVFGDVAWGRYPFFVVLVTQIFAGLFILRHNHLNAKDNLEKRQTKLVFWGSGASLMFLLLGMMLSMNIVPHFQIPDLLLRLIIMNIIFLFLLASPVSFAYAFGRYRLLEVEARLRRGTRFILVTGGLIVLFFGIVYLVGVILLEGIGITSRTPTLLIAIGLALGFAPAQRNLRNQLERRFYPEREKLRRMTREFLQTASTMPDCESLCRRLEGLLRESLGLKAVFIVLREQGNGSLVFADGEVVPVEEEGDLMVCLNREGHPLLVDEAVASSRICFSKNEWEWLVSLDMALILPLKTRSQVYGFLALGQKLGREDFHPEELQILTTLSDQFTLALENHRLLEENLEKRRMEEELQIARRVQLKFLPLEIPQTPGLDVSANSVFCLEVAGDYYDVIVLEDGRTALAVGDVSGKGAGAALIMANLQASLRSLCGVGLRLADTVARINDIIHGNTEPEQYITFFVGIFNPADKTFTYVNAGHNPPLLVRYEERIESLDVGGLILGAFPSTKYEQETISFSTGDLLFIYSDGVSEAMNEAEEEFGEERIRNALYAHSSGTVKEIMDNLIDEVESFRGDIPPGDDMTLLLAKVK